MTGQELPPRSSGTPTQAAEWFATTRRRVRLVVLLDAAEEAGLVPIDITRLHTLAYLSNVLAPVWDISVLDGKVLKHRGAPFYPALQHDLDRLVGMGVVIISGLGHSVDADGRWRLEGAYRLNRVFAEPVLRHLAAYDDESRLVAFVRELAYALSALGDDEITIATREDATYADPRVSAGNVIDFDEWQKENYSADAARCVGHLVPTKFGVTPGEKLHLYVRHLQRRIQGGR